MMTWPAMLSPSATSSPSSFLFPSSPPSFSSIYPSPSSLLFPAKKLRFSLLEFCAAKKRRPKRASNEIQMDQLESEIFEFMERSRNPNAFPTREELIAAGRADLAEAVARHGGWFTFGWDLERVGEEGDDEVSRISRDSAASTSGRSVEMVEAEVVEETGIEGILSRLEKQRRLLYGAGAVEKKMNGKKSWQNGESGGGDAGLIANDDGSSRSMPSDINGQIVHRFGSIHGQKQVSAEANNKSSQPDMWRVWSVNRAGNPTSEFEAAEIFPNYEQMKVNHEFNGEISLNGNEVAKSDSKIGQRHEGSQIDEGVLCMDQIRLHLQHLKSELNTSLHELQLRTNGEIIHKDLESSVTGLLRLSDDLEFKQTEIMNAKKKLRSIKAKLAVIEHKLQFDITEAQRSLDIRSKQLDAAQKAVHLLRNVSIAWPNSASEVLLAGSFDGWTSQRRMRRSEAGIFTLQLKLYPGRYEIKFIVDDMWMIDPLRPIVYNNGYENNLLVVS